MPIIAQVIIDLEVALNRAFDYLVPERWASSARVGVAVRVPFGKRTDVRGHIVGFTEKSAFTDLKEIAEVISETELIGPTIVKLAQWIAEYYAAPVDWVLRTVLPSPVRRKGEAFRENWMVAPTEAAGDGSGITGLTPRQMEILNIVLQSGKIGLSHLISQGKTTAATVRRVEKLGFIEIFRATQRRDPLKGQMVLPSQPLPLMPEQTHALEQVKRSMDTLDPPVILLYGVTGSGKTEIYLQAIRHGLEQGKGAIVLVPEISLTPQTIERFRARFGEEVAVLHSSLSDGERHDEWHRLREGSARIVVGARSALFAPVKNLGLIVVDEEHEPSYKQDETPRYHARDTAVMRGRMDRCAVLLGSATPALESYHNAHNGKYGLAVLSHRVDHCQMPRVNVVDMRVEAEREGRANVLSRALVEAIHIRIARAEQVMLFLNRRGYSSQLLCPSCGFVAQCRHCSVSMTYHRQEEKMICHMCGLTLPVPDKCPACGDPKFRYSGAGTQRVEAVIQKCFPSARVQRMDTDTTRQKDSHRSILAAFRTGKIDILVGTQMIAKGLHFPNVTLVGVVNADMGLHMPDFRAGERTFQLLTQVAGRAGRGDVPGEVIVQTYTPFHPALQCARHQDFMAFYAQEIEARRELLYPPFTHLVCVHFSGLVEEDVREASVQIHVALQPLIAGEVHLAEPVPAPLARIEDKFRYQIMLRARLTQQMTSPLKTALEQTPLPKGVRCSVDVDAYSLL